MNLASAFAILAIKGSAAASPGPGPSDPPTGLEVDTYPNDTPPPPPKARLSWTNGDTAAYTRVYQRTTTCAGAESLLTTVNPGQTGFDSEVTVDTGFLISHYLNGQESTKMACVLFTAPT